MRCSGLVPLQALEKQHYFTHKREKVPYCGYPHSARSPHSEARFENPALWRVRTISPPALPSASSTISRLHFGSARFCLRVVAAERNTFLGMPRDHLPFSDRDGQGPSGKRRRDLQRRKNKRFCQGETGGENRAVQEKY